MLRAIAAYDDVINYRLLVGLSQSFLDTQRTTRADVEQQIASGISAPGDLAQVDAVISNGEVRLVRYRRLAADAEATYQEIFGSPPPADLRRADAPDALVGEDVARTLALDTPAVRAAGAQARASDWEARAASADRLPRLSADLDAGRYRIFEDTQDYDVRSVVTMTMRFGGGLKPRASEARARADQARFRLDQVRGESERDAAIAATDVQALQDQLDAARANYIANRQARDVLIQRFRLTRGSLFNVLTVGDDFLGAAANYVLASAELDTARYTLLARTGRLLQALQINSPATMRP